MERRLAISAYVDEFSQSEIAADTGWSRQTINKKLKGHSREGPDHGGAGMTEHPSAAVLEAFSVGDPVEGAADVAAHVSVCDRCRAYLESLDDDRAQFLSDEAAATFLQRPQIRAALDALERPKRRSWRMLVPAVAAVAAVALVWPAIERSPESDEVRVKGASSSSLIVNRRRDGKVTDHAGQVTIRPLDQLQLSVQLSGPRTLTVGLLVDDGDWLPLVSPRVFAGRSPSGRR